MSNKTIDYYNTNSALFSSTTQNLSFTETQDRFLKYLPDNATILDYGCGAGRDSKYFLDKGYVVEALDGSIEMVRIATELTGLPVKHMFFNELSEINKYDGIWACSSILHCTKDELPDIFNKMLLALKDNGVIYTSFKYSDFTGDRNGRYFTDFTIESFKDFIIPINIRIEEYWISSDIRPGRSDEKWLNLILTK